MTTTLGMAEGVSWREGCLRLRGMSRTVRKRSELSSTVTNRSDSTTTKVCQATLRSGSELAGPRRAEEGHDSPKDEGMIPNGRLPTAGEELREREFRVTTDAATLFIPYTHPRKEFATLPGETKI